MKNKVKINKHTSVPPPLTNPKGRRISTRNNNRAIMKFSSKKIISNPLLQELRMLMLSWARNSKSTSTFDYLYTVLPPLFKHGLESITKQQLRYGWLPGYNHSGQPRRTLFLSFNPEETLVKSKTTLEDMAIGHIETACITTPSPLHQSNHIYRIDILR